MSEPKLYDNERDIMEMDRAGNYYCRHVSPMTRESLHSKSYIAAELGWRDMQIDQLKAENERLASELRAATVYMESLRLQRELDQTRAERAANPFHGMYQDAEGEIPVTSAGQLVGRVETCGEVMVQHLCQHRPTAMFGGTAVSFESPDEYEKWMKGEIE